MTSLFTHETVLLQEAVTALSVKPDGVYIDGTYGRGGHSAILLQQLSPNGRLVVIDKDPTAIADAQHKYAQDERVKIWQGSFKDFDRALADHQLPLQVHGLLLDLGVSSPQLDDAERGFSFMRQGALDMRMDPTCGLSAADWVNHAPEAEIADVIWRYGEERFSRQIARKILQVRSTQPITTTLQLADLIAQAVPKRDPSKHPATRSFQAIRMKVNQELEDVEQCLQKALTHLTLQGRLVVISFHSLEDRLVKHFMREHSTPKRLPKGLPVMDDITHQAPLRVLGKAMRASDEEVSGNVRSRSAMLRIAERVG